MATHSGTLAWKIPWTEEPGRLRSIGSWRVGTRLSDFTFTFHFHAMEKEMATHSSVPAWRIPGSGEPGGMLSMGSHRVTRLKWLSSSSCFNVFLLVKLYDALIIKYIQIFIYVYKICIKEADAQNLLRRRPGREARWKRETCLCVGTI